MHRLWEIGFVEVGAVQRAEGGISIELKKMSDAINVLYGFVVENQLKYIGKSNRSLSKRLYGYQAPGPTQSTNIRVRNFLLEALDQGARILIIAYADDNSRTVGAFHLNTADGLESSIIKVLKPEWNISGVTGYGASQSFDELLSGEKLISATEPTRSDAAKLSSAKSFGIELGKTYWDSGFFNVPVAFEGLFAGDGAHIDIFLGDNSRAIPGTINRAANVSRAPRIMGGAAMRDWIHRNCKLKGRLQIEVLSKREIRLIGRKK